MQFNKQYLKKIIRESINKHLKEYIGVEDKKEDKMSPEEVRQHLKYLKVKQKMLRKAKEKRAAIKKTIRDLEENIVCESCGGKLTEGMCETCSVNICEVCKCAPCECVIDEATDEVSKAEEITKTFAKNNFFNKDDKYLYDVCLSADGKYNIIETKEDITEKFTFDDGSSVIIKNGNKWDVKKSIEEAPSYHVEPEINHYNIKTDKSKEAGHDEKPAYYKKGATEKDLEVPQGKISPALEKEIDLEKEISGWDNLEDIMHQGKHKKFFNKKEEDLTDEEIDDLEETYVGFIRT